VARGAAYGDYDLDGDPDLLITTNNGPAKLLRNDAGSANRAVRLVLRGTGSNRNAIGARVAVRTGDRLLPRQMVKTGSSYLSQSELPLTFGLAGRADVQSIEVTWPSGKIERLGPEKSGYAITIEEGRGIVARVALR
jgi:enediyne biosynthesis protein E4